MAEELDFRALLGAGLSLSEQHAEWYIMATYALNRTARELADRGAHPGLVIDAMAHAAAALLASCPDPEAREELRRSAIAAFAQR
jgi:hypothetical protein